MSDMSLCMIFFVIQWIAIKTKVQITITPMETKVIKMAMLVHSHQVQWNIKTFNGCSMYLTEQNCSFRGLCWWFRRVRHRSRRYNSRTAIVTCWPKMPSSLHWGFATMPRITRASGSRGRYSTGKVKDQWMFGCCGHNLLYSLPIRAGDKIFYWKPGTIAGLQDNGRNAIILEVRLNKNVLHKIKKCPLSRCSPPRQ